MKRFAVYITDCLLSAVSAKLIVVISLLLLLNSEFCLSCDGRVAFSCVSVMSVVCLSVCVRRSHSTSMQLICTSERVIIVHGGPK